MTTQTQFQRVSLQAHQFSGLREPCWLWRHSPPLASHSSSGREVSTLSPARQIQAPCPRAWGAEERVAFCLPDCPFCPAPSPQIQGHFSSEWTLGDCPCVSPFPCHRPPPLSSPLLLSTRWPDSAQALSLCPALGAGAGGSSCLINSD